MNKDNKTSIFSYIGKIFLFIILLPFNIVKSINLGVNKLMKKDTNNTKEKLDLSKNVRDEEIKSEVTLKEINYPVKKGDLLGVIKYYNSNGTELGKLDIVSQNNLDEISFKNKMKIFLKEHGF